MNDDKKNQTPATKTTTTFQPKIKRKQMNHKNGSEIKRDTKTEKKKRKKRRAELSYNKNIWNGFCMDDAKVSLGSARKKILCCFFFLSFNVSIHKFTLYKHRVNVSECIQRQANTNRMRANGFIVWSRITYHRQRYLLYSIHNRKREK